MFVTLGLPTAPARMKAQSAEARDAVSENAELTDWRRSLRGKFNSEEGAKLARANSILLAEKRQKVSDGPGAGWAGAGNRSPRVVTGRQGAGTGRFRCHHKVDTEGDGVGRQMAEAGGAPPFAPRQWPSTFGPNLHPASPPCFSTLLLHPASPPCVSTLLLHPASPPCFSTLLVHPARSASSARPAAAS